MMQLVTMINNKIVGVHEFMNFIHSCFFYFAFLFVSL